MAVTCLSRHLSTQISIYFQHPEWQQKQTLAEFLAEELAMLTDSHLKFLVKQEIHRRENKSTVGEGIKRG